MLIHLNHALILTEESCCEPDEFVQCERHAQCLNQHLGLRIFASASCQHRLSTLVCGMNLVQAIVQCDMCLLSVNCTVLHQQSSRGCHGFANLLCLLISRWACTCYSLHNLSCLVQHCAEIWWHVSDMTGVCPAEICDIISATSSTQAVSCRHTCCTSSDTQQLSTD